MPRKSPQTQLRFRVTFELEDGACANYCVATLRGESKAIVMATLSHKVKSPHTEPHIMAVQSVEALPGEQPRSGDLVDRMEW